MNIIQIALLEIQEEGLALQENSLLDNTYQAMDFKITNFLEIQRQKELVSNCKLKSQKGKMNSV